jgi:hypothetical protein
MLAMIHGGVKIVISIAVVVIGQMSWAGSTSAAEGVLGVASNHAITREDLKELDLLARYPA